MEVFCPRISLPVAESRSRVSCRETVHVDPAGMVWVTRVCHEPRVILTS